MGLAILRTSLTVDNMVQVRKMVAREILAYEESNRE